jgi:hypothetical protein
MARFLARCMLVAGILSVCSGARAVAFAEAEITAVRAGVLGQPLVDQGISFAGQLYSDQAAEIGIWSEGWSVSLTFGQTLVYEFDYAVRVSAGTVPLPYNYIPACAPVMGQICAPLFDVDNAWAFLSIGTVDPRAANPFVSRTGAEQFTLTASNGETFVRSGTVRVLLELTSPFAPDRDFMGAGFFLQAVGAIPEPEVYALMLAGLLLVAAHVQHRRG